MVVFKTLTFVEVPVNKELFTGSVPVNKELMTGTVPVNYLNLISIIIFTL